MNDEIKELITNMIYDDNVEGFMCNGERYKEFKNGIIALHKENEGLKERCDYLQRSCDRKEEQRDYLRKVILMKDNNYCVDLSSVLLEMFIVLKLCNVITWDWIWVLSPLWISICLYLIVYIVIWFIGKF